MILDRAIRTATTIIVSTQFELLATCPMRLNDSRLGRRATVLITMGGSLWIDGHLFGIALPKEDDVAAGCPYLSFSC